MNHPSAQPKNPLNSPTFLNQRGSDLEVLVTVKPSAKKSGVTGVHAGRIKISITAPPDKGKANSELIAVFADLLEKPKRDIEVMTGHASPQKKLRITDYSAERFLKKLT